jgi:acyl carrier protein
MTNEARLTELVTNAIATVLNIPASRISSEVNLIRDLGVQSIDILDIGFELEVSIRKSINFADILRFARSRVSGNAFDLKVRDIVEYLMVDR